MPFTTLPKAAKPAPKQAAKPAGALPQAKEPAAAKKTPAKDIPSGDPDVTPAVPPATVPRKSSEMMEGPTLPNPPPSAATPAITPSLEVAKPVAVLAEPERIGTSPGPPTQMTAAVKTAAPLTTASITAAPLSSAPLPSPQALAVTPFSLQTSPKPPDEQPLPARARYVEMVCGVDYRQDGRQFARAFEITHASSKTGGDQTEILAFDLACERAPAGGHVPRTVLRGADAEIVKTSFRRAPDGGWNYGHHRTHRQVRVRIEGEVLTLVPSAAEVAVLRKKLAENPAQLDALSPEARHTFELAVAGEGFPEFRLVRAADGLDAAFELAGKNAKHYEHSVSAAEARP